MRTLFILVFPVIFFTGCTKEKKSSSQLITELLNKYPALKPEFGEIPYQLVRQIKDMRWQAEFELYEDRWNAGILIIRKNDLAYCIPLFADKSEGINTSFEKELKAANDKLRLLKRVDFINLRYIFIQVLGLREECEDSNNVPKLPFQVTYSGRYRIIETVYSRDSVSFKVENNSGVD